MIKQLELPKSIKVKIEKCNHNKYIAVLPEYNTHTEANSETELLFMVNDLIMSLFDIPSNLQGKIFYKPVSQDDGFKKAEPFIRLTSPDVLKYLNG